MLQLGLDLGSVTAKVAILEGGTVRHVAAVRTRGRPARVVRLLLRRAAATLGDVRVRVVATGSGKGLVPDPAGRASEIIAHARAAASLHPEARTVLEIGGQDAKLIWLSESGDGRVLDHAMNDLCAAGTGAFLDQQASRLGMSAERMGRLAVSSASPATVAGRCAVFAKTDMIHLQQRGVPAADICAGVCHALVRNVVATLARGRELRPPLLFQGGVSLSAGVRAALASVAGIPPGSVIVPARPVAMGAIGAALLAGRMGGRTTLLRLLASIEDEPPPPAEGSPPPLRSPSGAPDAPVPAGPPPPGPYGLGIDVGSASTKAVLLGADGGIAAWAYLQTAGRPLEAVHRVLESLASSRPGAQVRSTCVTGSGRHLAALWLGADATVDEITAQARGAPDLAGAAATGVIEIGGQDAKAIALSDGRVRSFAMNRLCAAGTGSFLEEQAARLGVPIVDFAGLAFRSRAPAPLAGKCAVFMDADLVHHQQHGAKREDLLAGLAHAVVDNYLRRVSATLDLGARPVFQGGVARNLAVVAAFERALGGPVAVNPHAAVSGAVGAALSAPPAGVRTRSIDELARLAEPATAAVTCRSCENRCEITTARAGDGTPVTLGGACGKYDRGRLEPGARRREDALAALLAARERARSGEDSAPAGARAGTARRRTIGVPRAILGHDLLPFFRSFLGTLGYDVVASGPSRKDMLRRVSGLLTAEPCLPAKLMLGHVAALADEGVEAVFLPAILSMPEAVEETARSEPSRMTRRQPCMYGLGSADMACAASLVDEPAGLRGRAGAGPSRLEIALRRALGQKVPCERSSPAGRSGRRPRLVAPELNLDPRSSLFRPMLAAFARAEGLDPQAAWEAAPRALEAYRGYRRRLAATGAEYLEANGGAPVAVVLGHPYVVHDPFLNLQTMRRLARAGFVPLPYDMVPDPAPLDESWAQVGWLSNRDLLRAAAWASGREGVHPVILTCFGCGPDAFVARFLEETIGDRPRLTLEFDEHQAEAGVETRIEAFRHAVGDGARPPAARAPSRRPGPIVTGRLDDARGRTIVMPRFGDNAAAFRGYFEARGLDARVGPEIDERTFAAGRALVGGQECNPFAYFVGDMLRALREKGAEPSMLAFYLPSTEGACLLSQYGRGFASAARRTGADGLAIYNPAFGELTSGASTGLLVRFWQALVAIDAVGQLAADLRPFERERGSTDRARWTAVTVIGDAVARGRVPRAVEEAVDIIASVPRDAVRPRPAVGIVGDLFTRACDSANGRLARALEEGGCRLLVPPNLSDVAAYTTGEWEHVGRLAGEHLFALRAVLLETYQRVSGVWTTAPISRLSRPRPLDRTYRDVAALVRPYLGRPSDAVLTLNVSQAVDQLEAGARGVLSVICHGCMVGILSESAFRPLRDAYPGRPIVTLTYDGLGETHVATRVEAFVQRIMEAQEDARGGGLGAS